jgi:hypothetical protein
MPLALLALAPVVPSGERVTAIGPTCEPSQQLPPPFVQGQLQELAGEQQFPFPADPPAHGAATVPTPPVGQSRVKPVELTATQAIPARGPRSQVPVAGEIAEHFGHGWARLPVR